MVQERRVHPCRTLLGIRIHLECYCTGVNWDVREFVFTVNSESGVTKYILTLAAAEAILSSPSPSLCSPVPDTAEALSASSSCSGLRGPTGTC